MAMGSKVLNFCLPGRQLSDILGANLIIEPRSLTRFIPQYILHMAMVCAAEFIKVVARKGRVHSLTKISVWPLGPIGFAKV